MTRRKIRKGSPPKMVPNGVWVFSTIFNQCVVISQKRCILRTKLLCDGNRKPYAGYWMVSLSMTLSDPWPVTVVLKGEYLENGAFYTQSYHRTVIGNHNASYRMMSLSMTLSDSWPGFQGHGNFRRRISRKRCILQIQLLYRTLIGNRRHAIDKQASYTAYNPTALT